MRKRAHIGMRLHQALSFSRLFTHIPESEVLFWPGCALLDLDRGILDRALTVLRRAEPAARLACACCGQPSACLFPEKAQAHRRQTTQLLRRRGVRRIYTACPNCTVQLRELEGVEILPVWPALARHAASSDTVPAMGDFVWHDPCPTRGDREVQEAVRQLLTLSGCSWAEPPHTGKNTLCCGNVRMLHITDPERSAALRSRRLEELPGDRTILSCCEGCLRSFRGEGRRCLHLLELLFGPSEKRGWGNRLKTALRAKSS